MSGCEWLCVVVCGCVWLCVVVCGCVCSCVVVSVSMLDEFFRGMFDIHIQTRIIEKMFLGYTNFAW